MKVLVADKLDRQGVEILMERGLEVEVKTDLSPKELEEKIKDYDALIVRSATKVTEDIIKAADRLKVIGRAGVGIDNVDVEAATKKGIVVMNSPTGNTISAAEHALAMLLSLSRNVPQAHSALKEKRWEKKKFVGVEVYRKTLGIVGLGRVGTHLARIARGIGMEVIGHDPFITKEKAHGLGVELVEFEELLKKADYISFHTPLTSETYHLIGREEMRVMKKNARIINCARGGIIDEDALFEALQEGRIAGAALDVFEEEPPSNLPLLELENVVVTPHLGASTHEAQFNVAVDIAESVASALNRGIYKNAVNIPTIEASQWEEIKPYLLLGEKIGSFQGQLLEGNIDRIEISYAGEVTSFNLSLITASLLKGLLHPVFSESINYVNAGVLAAGRGIKITEHKSQKAENFASIVSLKITTDGNVCTIAGILFGEREPRIVQIDDYSVEVIPEGEILLCYNEDKPGLIGKIGTILGKSGINIGYMTYGKKTYGGEAITVLKLDTPLKKEIEEKIKNIEEVKKVKLLKL